MAMMIVGLLLMLGIHSVKVVAPGWRRAAIARLGEGSYRGVYSVVSLVGLVLVVWGFARAREAPVSVYTPPGWGRHVAMALMMPALILVFASVFPARGIKRFVAHPLLSATALWALAHLFANGDLAGVVLFGAILAWAVTDRLAQPRPLEAEAASGAFGKGDLAAMLAGVALYIVLIAGLHYWLFGVSPIV
jgi:uncharacterized membrane protein